MIGDGLSELRTEYDKEPAERTESAKSMKLEGS